MAAGFSGDWLYQLALNAGSYDDDTAASMDPKLVQQWREMNKIVADYRAKRDKTAAVERAADLKARLEYIKSGRETVAKLEETAGKDRRVSAQVKKDLQVQLMRSRTELATKSAQFQSRVFNPAKAAFDGARGMGQSGAVAASDSILNTLTAEGVGYNPQDPSVGGLAEQYALMVFGKPLAELSEQEVQAKIKADGGGDTLQARAAQFVRDGKQAVAAARGAEAVLNEQQRLINSIGVGPGGMIEGEDADRLVSATKKAQAAFESLAGRSPESLSAEIETLAADDSEYQRLLKSEQELKDKVFQPGSEGLRKRMGRFIANPEVQEWAAAYGYKAGEAKVGPDGEVVYVPGPDDDKILMRFSYQATQPDRFGRLFKNQGATRDLVRITATDPEQRAKLLEANDLGGGRFAIQAGPDGDTVLSKEAYESELKASGMRPGGFQYAKAGGKGGTRYVKSSAGAYYKYSKEDGKFTSIPANEVPAGLKFQDAVIFDGTTPVRYMTGEDLEGGIAGMGLSYADPKEAQQIEAKTPSTIKIVGADQVPAGTITAVGYLDKPRAGQPKGTVSINNGQQVFTKDVKVEVLAKDAEKKPVSRLAAKAEREAAKLGDRGLTQAQVLGTTAKEPPATPVAPVDTTEQAREAARDPVGGEMRLEMLINGNQITPAQAEQARREVADAQAELAAGKKPTTPAPAPFVGEDGWKYQFVGDKVYVVGKEGGSTTASPENPIELKDPKVAAKAKAELDAAKKAAKQEPLFLRTKEGAVYEVGPNYARMIRGEDGKVPSARPSLMYKGEDDYNALLDKLAAERPTQLTKEVAAAAAPPKPAKFEEPKPEPTVTRTPSGATRIEAPGIERPTRREALKATLSKVGDIFKKKAAPERDVPPPSPEAAAALADKSERLKKTPAPTGPAPEIDLDEDTAPAAPGAPADKRQTPLSTFRMIQKKAKEPSGGPNVLGATTTPSGVA